MSDPGAGNKRTKRVRLGVNVDHVATLRNARGGAHPDPVRAAQMAIAAGADGITAHLREDRRHITDIDIARLVREVDAPLNLEMAATDGMTEIALAMRPHACCIVPEKREERTTEGGIDAVGQHKRLAPLVRALGTAGIRVSLFIEPEALQLEAAQALGAPVVELHTGAYCDAVTTGETDKAARLLDSLRQGARYAAALGLEVHGGHGLDFHNVGAVAAFPEIAELNIGHYLVGEAVFTGLDAAIRRMRALIEEARA
jgi:pyridoxine 5-phosphate synthase